MKRVFTLIIVAFMLTAFSQVQAQVLLTSGFETWSGLHHPQGWVGLKTNVDTTTGIIQYTSTPHAGTYSVQLVNTTTTMKRFTTQPFTISTGTAYEIKYWAKGTGSFRTGITDGVAAYSYGATYYILTSSPWTLYTDTVYGNGNTTTGEFIFGFKSTAAADHIVIDDVTITQLAITIPEVSIYDIQYTTDVTGNSPQMNNMVKTGGIVTATGSGYYFIQSHTGPWNGIEVYDGTNTPAVGDSVLVTGQVQEYFNLTEIGNVSGFTNVSSGNTLPGPEVVPNVVVNSEAYECVFVQLVNVTCADSIANGIWRAWDGNDTAYVDDILYHSVPVIGDNYDVTGIVTYNFSKFKVLPRSAADVVLSTVSIEETNSIEVAMYPNPVVNELNLFVNGQVDMIRVTDMLGNMVISQNTNGLNNLTIDFSAIRTGNYVVSLMKDGEIVARQIVVKQ